MSYFRELPNISYVSLLNSSNRNDERITVKNLFKRAKIRSDVDSVITAFEYYKIEEGIRPDILAERLYNDPELDWVILITNNITNIKDQWPLDNNSLNNHMLEKYGSDSALASVHHYETTELKDEYGRIILNEGLEVDENFQFTYMKFNNTIVTANPTKPISNYEYEVRLNEQKRIIKVLRKQYLSVFITDMRNIMTYDESSQYESQSFKKSYNPRITGV